MSNLAAAAAALNAPEEMVERSARARAQAEGVSVEDVLSAWATGGDIVAGAGGSAPAAAAPSAPPAAEQPVSAPEAGAGALEVEVLGPEVEVGSTVPAEPAAVEIDDSETEEGAVAAGAMPRWLVALFLLLPTIAVGYALFLPNGPSCGDGGRLAVDPVSGEAINCDGSSFGADEIDFFAIGQGAYATCAACHGAEGGGIGTFPALAGEVLVTFPAGDCSDHVEWVQLGTAGWPDETYGETDKSVGGSGTLMPPFGTALSDQELRSVVLYERVTFGGQSVADAIADCGLGGASAESAALGG